MRRRAVIPRIRAKTCFQCVCMSVYANTPYVIIHFFGIYTFIYIYNSIIYRCVISRQSQCERPTISYHITTKKRVKVSLRTCANTTDNVYKHNTYIITYIVYTYKRVKYHSRYIQTKYA